MKTGKIRGYVLIFRCIKCGNNEVCADYPTEHIIPEQRIRDRINQVRCNSCGWNGDVCGLSAVCVSHTQEPKARDRDSVCDAPAHLLSVRRPHRPAMAEVSMANY